MSQLLQLDQCRRIGSVPAILQKVTIPLKYEEWQRMLQSHWDQALVQYILSGIREGFRIGFDYGKVSCKPAKCNLLSAEMNPDVVTAYLQEEVALGRVLGPLQVGSIPGVQVSPFGVIPKGHTPGKWRLIVDLSSPKGSSVNDGISPDLCSLSYISVDDISKAVASLGRGALLAKIDIKSAYRIVPIHPDDRPLLGMLWKRQLYVDTCLPFGLRSAPRIFTALADMLEWGVKEQGVSHLFHYLDDYITIGSAESEECKENAAALLATCSRLGVPIAPDKCEGPATRLTYLGIEVDTIQMQLRLPVEKLRRVQTTVREWLGRKAGRRRELESLVGLLQHAAKVVRPGRRFVRRTIVVMTAVKDRDRFVRLNAEIRSDLYWWSEFVANWNGVGIIMNPDQVLVNLESDASGSWGCGATWGTHWLQWKWNPTAQQWDISPKELLPILLACVVWGRLWSGKKVRCHCDNMAVVEVVNNGYSKDKLLMHLIRCLFFISEHFKVQVEAVHCPGKDNIRADALSRNEVDRFLQALPGADQKETDIPQQLLTLLVDKQPDWMSSDWTRLFTASIRQV